jgi:hypothetical protein
MDEEDVFAAASVLIAQHGERAAAVAADNFVQLKNAGDANGMAFWASIMMAIRRLTEDSPR